MQWHALAVALAELCVQTEGVLVDRAWTTVERVLPLLSHKVADSKKGALWRPIRKLLRKARERRAEAQSRRKRIDEGGVAAPIPPAQKERVRKNTELPYPPPFSQDTYLQLEKGTAEGRRRAAGPSPFAAATEVGPTGIPSSADFSNMGTTAPTTSTAVASPPAAIYQHVAPQWAIDFDDMDLSGEAVGVNDPQQELDMMDWSAWNDFVNDANVGLEDDSTTPSSEGKEADAQAAVARSPGAVITEREMPVGSLFG